VSRQHPDCLAWSAAMAENRVSRHRARKRNPAVVIRRHTSDEAAKSGFVISIDYEEA